MDRSRSPRVMYPRTPLSDEARFLQRLAEGAEMTPATTDAERTAARAEWAGAVEEAVNELGEH